VLPELIGGSADLNPSTLTYLKVSGAFQHDAPQHRNIHFGVREHGVLCCRVRSLVWHC
jgi:transketolase